MLDKIGYAILDKLAKTAFWEWFVKKFLSNATARVFGYPSFPMTDFFTIQDLMDKDGKFYAFVCSDYSSIGSKTIRTVGDFLFTHAGLLVQSSDERKTKCLHMRSSGLHYEHFLSLLREVDYIAVVEVPLIEGGIKMVQERMAQAWVNRDKLKYDFEEKLDNDPNMVYCSEFFLNICGDVCRIKPRTQRILGRDVFTPDNILGTGKVIYTNHEGVARKFGLR